MKHIGLLTAGGDCQGLNAALRGVTLSAINKGWRVSGFHDGFVGLAEGVVLPLNADNVGAIIAQGGTILGTGRGGGRAASMAEAADACLAQCRAHQLDALVCLGGDGTQRFSQALHQRGLPVVTLPKTMDNDIACTDITFGFDSALQVAMEALDRLRTTGDSHHRLMMLEVMGRDAGWVAAGAAMAGGVDVVMVPEIPYRLDKVVEHLKPHMYAHRSALMVIAEGAISAEEAAAGLRPRKHAAAMRLVDQLPELTGMEARLTMLGYVIRGGSPSASDRILSTMLGARAVDYIEQGRFGVMVASQGGRLVPADLDDVAGNPRLMPTDHAWFETLKATGACVGC